MFMSNATSDRDSKINSTGFREDLSEKQPEVLRFLEQELDGPCQKAAVELASRYFTTSERWGARMPTLKRSKLRRELSQQDENENPDPDEPWMAQLPVPESSNDQRSLGRVLRALVSVSQKSA